MKKSKLTLVAIFMLAAVQLFSQSNSVFIVIDEIAEDITELKSEFSGQPNVYVTDGISPSAIVQISDALKRLQIADLHIYVSTKPGAIVFNSIAITENILTELSTDLEAWSRSITGRVVIHSDVVFEGEEGSLLKQRLEEITGLVFINQN